MSHFAHSLLPEVILMPQLTPKQCARHIVDVCRINNTKAAFQLGKMALARLAQGHIDPTQLAKSFDSHIERLRPATLKKSMPVTGAFDELIAALNKIED